MTALLERLDPSSLITQQEWKFATEAVIRIGRDAESNQIVIDHPAVSNFHVMIWRFGKDWKIVNLSCHGTYLDNQLITSALLSDGAIIRLSPDGPRFRFRDSANQSSPVKRQPPNGIKSVTRRC